MSGSSIVVVDTDIGGVTKAEAGKYKEAAGPGVVTEKCWIEFVFPVNPPYGEGKSEPTVGMITKETVPDSFIDRLKEKPFFTKLPPITDAASVYDRFPKERNIYLAGMVSWNYCIDLHVDVLRQHAEKGFAEVGVDFTDGVKKIFILPQPVEGL